MTKWAIYDRIIITALCILLIVGIIASGMLLLDHISIRLAQCMRF